MGHAIRSPRRTGGTLVTATLVGLVLVPVAGMDAAAADDAAALAQRAADLEAEVGLLEARHELEKLQRTFGYYVDQALWTHAASLLTDDAELEVAGQGVWVGRERVREYLGSYGEEYPQPGRLYDHMQLQAVVHVAPDARSAQGRWRYFDQDAVHGEYARWNVGVYEVQYARVDGSWMISRLTKYPRMSAPDDEGWARTALPPHDPGIEPDRASRIDWASFPGTSHAPLHYAHPVDAGLHPVTGRAQGAQVTARSAAAEPGEVAQTLDDLDRRLTRLEDVQALERLHVVYGYYLARNEWDNLANLFAEDGTIEIAQRGVYVGRDSVRRNLNLYGEPGIHHGVQHNHMQYQPVVNVDEDGQHARIRSRAFSIMGNHGTPGFFMAGVYENTFSKIDGVWKFQTDQVFNTYFRPYDVSFRDLPRRDPPGITEENPPDLPPSVRFDLYPEPFLPPFHYPNPVTGEAVDWPERD